MATDNGPPNLSRCRELAGYSTECDANAQRAGASELYANPNIQKALAHHHEIAASKVSVTRGRLAVKMLEIIDTGRKDAPTAGDQVRAADRLAKLFGLDSPTKVEATVTSIAVSVNEKPA